MYNVSEKRVHSYQAADIFDVHDEKLFSAMCTWSNHCLHHLLPSEHDTGHDLRRRGHSYQLVTWFVISLALLGVASLFVCCMIHCKHLRLSDANKLSYLLTYLLIYLLHNRFGKCIFIRARMASPRGIKRTLCNISYQINYSNALLIYSILFSEASDWASVVYSKKSCCNNPA